MKNILSDQDIKKFKEDGAIFLQKKFDIKWIDKLQRGIQKDI